jgi:hypothetical protein
LWFKRQLASTQPFPIGKEWKNMICHRYKAPSQIKMPVLYWCFPVNMWIWIMFNHSRNYDFDQINFFLIWLQGVILMHINYSPLCWIAHLKSLLFHHMVVIANSLSMWPFVPQLFDIKNVKCITGSFKFYDSIRLVLLVFLVSNWSFI